jgi:serine phosphatase RsbU (regulator of sigma subunit)
MVTTNEAVRIIASRSTGLLRSILRRQARLSCPADPLHCDVPKLRSAQISCIYYAQRVAGDFYEFMRVSSTRMLFALLDVAGRRGDTREVLIAAQNTFRQLSPKLFGAEDLNEAEAMSELCHHINRTILQGAGGVRSCSAFIGCYNENLGTVCYSNAGHTPGLLRDGDEITRLPAAGLPLGLFSHTVHGASTCALVPGAALLIVSRGLIETECHGEEFELAGVMKSLARAPLCTAPDLCVRILEDTREFGSHLPTQNDLTVMALLRKT